MNIDKEKKRQPLGRVLIELEQWRRAKIKHRLKQLGVNHSTWKRLLSDAEAHKLPTYIKDVIVDEIPYTEPLFQHPKLIEA